MKRFHYKKINDKSYYIYDGDSLALETDTEEFAKKCVDASNFDPPYVDDGQIKPLIVQMAPEKYDSEGNLLTD